jgi:CheY-like chemotaxis protein
LLRKVYEPFFTTKASGTGLGLSTAREIVSEQGGALMLDSVVGQGTTATIWLPLIEHEASDAPVAESPIQGDGEVVLLVAASELVRMRTEELLAALGYEPVGFATAAAAAEALRKAPKRFDAMLVGDMPLDSDTHLLLETARKLAPEMPRIFSIMHAADYHADKLVEAGITTVVQFPPEPREVAMTLGRLLAAARQDAQPRATTV